MNKLLDFLKPSIEKQEQKESISEEDRKKLLDAEDALEFLDRAAGIAQKYGLIEGQSDPYMKFMLMLGNSYMEMMSWRMREDWKEWNQMRNAKAHP